MADLRELEAEFVARAQGLRFDAERLDAEGRDHDAAALRGRARGYEEAAQAVRSTITQGRVPTWGRRRHGVLGAPSGSGGEVVR